MEKAKKILSQADTNIAEAKKAVADSDATVAEAKQSIAEERRTMPDSAPTPEQREDATHPLNFPVVGIGTSAGGLEALQAFFEHLASPPGAAFVIVQHLSPDHDSFMAELLRRYTPIPVDFIRNGVPVENNHIYLIPPKVNITIRDGRLYHTPIVGHGLNLPIDIFFRSLANDQQSNAVAVILSGAGSDGTLGIRAIKEFGGIAMVQDPRDAKFDGMPKSALSTDMIDLVRSAADLAVELASCLGHPLFAHPGPAPQLISDNQTQYNRIMAILKNARKVDFSSYRLETITRRLEKRISINRFSNLTDYVDYLEKNPPEIDTLFHEILIGVTRFFRDEDAFANLERLCFPEMFKNCRNGELRVWVASCSTGEEAYSIAILLKEYMLKNRVSVDLKIFATDIDDKSLKFAATGFYPQNVVSDIPPQYLAKYFSPRGNGYQINPDIRRMIIFASQDLIDNPPFFKLDLVTCRNFLIYICREAQQRVLSSFYVGLNPGGFLFLGPSESLEELSKGFDTVAAREKIFRKHDGYTPQYSPKSPMPLHLSMLEHARRDTKPATSPENNELLAILEQIDNAFLPPSLVVDADCNIIYAIRDGGKLLHLSSGRITTNLLKILPKSLSLIVSSMVRRAAGRAEIITSELVLDKRPMVVRCKHIVPECTGVTYFYLGFEESADRRQKIPRLRPETAELADHYQERIDELEAEVRQQKDSLKIAVEQLETSNEELQASNEELVASNEELQSSNEELQSVNEELYTVNIEHVRKLEEISELNCDYDNLLSNLKQIGTLFLDSRLVIRRISKIAGSLTGIMQSDIGRPLSYFSLKKLYPRFLKDVERVNSAKEAIERELPIHGKTYCMRIVPYQAEEKTLQGVIITFVDLTDCKMRALREASASQEKLLASTAQLEAAAAIARMAYFRINTRTRKCTGSRLLRELWPLRNGCVPRPAEWIHPDDLPEVNARFDELRSGAATSILLSFRSDHFGELRYYRMGASISGPADGTQFINGVIQDTTGVITARQQQEARERLWEASINAMPVLFYAKDADGDFRYVYANRCFLDFTGRRLDEIVGRTDEEITPSGGRFRAEDLQTLDSPDGLSFANEAVMPDGGIRYFHTTKRQSPGPDGHRLILGVGADVTEQRLSRQDMQTANQCLETVLESAGRQTALRKIMQLLCERLGASHAYWMSFDHAATTVRCEFEYARPGSRKLFGGSEAMPFDPQSEWYRCYQNDQVLDIPDIPGSPEATALLETYCGFPRKLKAKSLYSIGFRHRNRIVGAVGFLYTGARPAFSRERLSYLMKFSANLFKSLLLRKFGSESEHGEHF